MDASGRSLRSSVVAESARAAREKLRRDGVFLTELVEGRSEAPSVQATSFRRLDLPFLRRIPPMDRAVAARQLATLVGAGVPLVEALGALVEQVEHGRLRAALAQVRDRVNEGASLADALDQAAVFDELFVNMVRAGEASGALEAVLARIADYWEDQVRLRNKVGSILVYPLVMFGFAMVVVAALVTVVLPQITELLQSLGQPLPIYTRWIIAVSSFAREWWWAVLIVLAAAAAGLRAGLATERGRALWDRASLRVPILGRVIRLLAIARFTRTLATLLAGGVPIVRALEISRHVARNASLAAAIDAARQSLMEGAPLARPLRASGEVPPLVTHMVEVGERSGELEAMLAKVADTYDQQVETTVTRLTALLEPLLILLMVGLVLVIILATLVPLLEITSSLG
jgi:general secretion pathway protein F